MKRWLSALPAEVASFRPRLLVAQTWMALVAADVEGAEASLDAAERAFADAAGEPFEPSVGRATSFLVNVPAAIALGRAALAQLRGAEGTAAFASRALTETRKGEWMLDSVARGYLAVTEQLRGRLAAAERGFAAVLAGCLAVGGAAWPQ